MNTCRKRIGNATGAELIGKGGVKLEDKETQATSVNNHFWVEEISAGGGWIRLGIG